MFNQFYFIYSITNIKNHKRYIGYTNDLNRRLYDHWTQLILKQHPNNLLQQEFNEENFTIEVLQTCININNHDIAELEKEFIKKYNSFKDGYNQTQGGEISTLRNNTEDKLLEAAFILKFYDNSSPVVQKLLDMSESSVLRLKNKQTHLHIHNIINNMNEDTINNFKDELEVKYNLNELLDTHKKDVTYHSRSLTREDVLQIIAVCNNRERVGATVERFLGLANQHTSRIKRGLRYKEYYNEYNNMSDSEKNEWLESGLKRFNIK